MGDGTEDVRAAEARRGAFHRTTSAGRGAGRRRDGATLRAGGAGKHAARRTRIVA